MNSQKDRLDQELAEQMDKIQRAQKTFNSKFNNVRSVKGDFENTKENYEILTEIESLKNKHLLGALL